MLPYVLGKWPVTRMAHIESKWLELRVCTECYVLWYKNVVHIAFTCLKRRVGCTARSPHDDAAAEVTGTADRNQWRHTQQTVCCLHHLHCRTEWVQLIVHDVIIMDLSRFILNKPDINEVWLIQNYDVIWWYDSTLNGRITLAKISFVFHLDVVTKFSWVV